MAIEYVGGKITAIAPSLSGGTITLDQLTGGIAAVPSPGDIVIANYAIASASDRDPTPTITGPGTTYTNYRLGRNSLDTLDIEIMGWWGFMNDPVDAYLSYSSTENINDAGVVSIQVFRGCTTPNAAHDNSASGTNTFLSNPAIATNAAAGNIAVVAGAGVSAIGGTFSSPDLEDFLAINSPGTNDCMLGVGWHTNDSGPFNAGVFTQAGGTDSTNNANVSINITLVPGSYTPLQLNPGMSAARKAVVTRRRRR